MNKGWMLPILLFVLGLYYCYLYFYNFSVDSPPSPSKKDFQYQIGTTLNDDVTFHTSTGNTWTFPLEPEYYFAEERIWEKDVCFGQPDETLLPASGPNLYLFLLRRGFTPTDQPNHYYFRCRNGRILDVLLCPENSSSACVPANPCIDQYDGSVLPDPTHRRFYYECQNQQPIRIACPPQTFFYYDACTSRKQFLPFCENEGQQFPIDEYTYFECRGGRRPKMIRCPPGEKYSTRLRRCVSDLCDGFPNDAKRPMPLVQKGSFLYSPGYAICENGSVRETVSCPLTLDSLLPLPRVYDPVSQTCQPPLFCENVQPVSKNIVIPAHEYTKHLPSYPYSPSLDRAVAYTCDPTRKRIVLEPGYRVSDQYTVEWACPSSSSSLKIPIGDTGDRYFSCARNQVETCPPQTFFDGHDCRPHLPGAFRYRHLDVFKLNQLSVIANWIRPWAILDHEPRAQCDEESDEVYIPGYNMCSHPDCTAYPFLKELKTAIYLPLSPHMCIFEKGKIRKKRVQRRRRGLKFWSQQFVTSSSSYRVPETCREGHRIRSGRFVLDSVLYATCNWRQPFVFCPSSSTEGIQATPYGYHVCVPKKEAYEGILPAGISLRLEVQEVSRILPEHGARYRIDGREAVFDATTQHPDGIPISSAYEIWSERDLKLFFRILVTHPRSAYWEDGVLKALPDPEKTLLYTGETTEEPVTTDEYSLSADSLIHEME